MGRRIGLVLLVASVLVPVGASVPLVHYWALLEPARSIRTEGSLTVEAVELAGNATWVAESTHRWGAAPRARMEVHTYYPDREIDPCCYSGLLGLPAAVGTLRKVADSVEPMDPRPPPEVHDVEDLQIEAEPVSHQRVEFETARAGVRLEVTDDCEVRRAGTLRFSPFVAQTDFEHAGAAMEVRCTAAANVERLTRWGATAGAVHLRFREDGAASTMDLRLGETREPHPTTGLPERVVRSLLVFSEVGELTLPSEATARFVAPIVGVVGRITLPASNGTLQWGDWRVSPLDQDVVSEGAFVLAAPDSNVTVQGMAAPRPVDTPAVAAPDPGIPLAPAVWMALGFVALLGLAKAASMFFTRLDAEKALANERRRAILQIAAAEPGVRVQDVARRLETSWTAVNRHVEVLVRQGLLSCRRDQGQTALFLPGSLTPQDQTRMTLARRSKVPRLLELLRLRPDVTQEELAAALGVRQSYVSGLLRQLAEAGLVRIEPRGRGRRYVATIGPASPKSNTSL